MAIQRQELSFFPAPQEWSMKSKVLVAFPLIASLIGGIALGLYGPQAVGLSTENCTVSQICLLRGAGVIVVALAVNVLHQLPKPPAESSSEHFLSWWRPPVQGVLSLAFASAIIWGIGLALYGPHALGHSVNDFSANQINLIRGGGALLFTLSAYGFHRLLSPPNPKGWNY